MKSDSSKQDTPTTWRDWASPGVAAALSIVAVLAAGVFWAAHSASSRASEAAEARLRTAADTASATLQDHHDFDAALRALAARLADSERPITVERIGKNTPILPGQSDRASIRVQFHESGPTVLLGTQIETEAFAAHAAAPGIVALLAIAGCVVVSYRSIQRTAVLRRIGSALGECTAHVPDTASLRIAPRFGPAAVAWNNLLTLADDIPGNQAHGGEERRGETRSTMELPTGTLDAMPMGVLAIDAAGRIVVCNGAAGSMLGVPRSELLGAVSEGVESLAEIGPAVESALRGDALRESTEISRTGGADRGVIRATVRTLRQSDRAAVLVVLEDITQQRLAEDARNAFVAQATHELRAPLTNIRLCAEEAIEVGSEDPVLLARSLNVVNTEAHRLERVVQDMLSVAEIEAASMSLQIDDVPLPRLLADLETDYTAQAAERGIAIRFDLPAKLEPLRADRDKLALSLHNVLGNAIKYTPAGGTVEVRARQDEQDLVVAVTDTGPGISPEDHEKIFQKFYRTDTARGSDVNGSGLGLALAREVARLHGGDITVESEPGRGSTFTVRVPRGQGESGTQAPGRSTDRAAA